MGGAPAIYLKQWPRVLEALQEQVSDRDWIFNSDFLLNEGTYKRLDVERVKHPRAVYAVDIKGLDSEEYSKNTRKRYDEELLWRNLSMLVEVDLHYYLTFTNVRKENIEKFWDVFEKKFGAACASIQKNRGFSVDLIDYEAVPFVDNIEWGRRPKRLS